LSAYGKIRSAYAEIDSDSEWQMIECDPYGVVVVKREEMEL
jgi:hypothetical protein